MVSVRSRHWMVTDVSASILPPDPLKSGLAPPQHLLTLSSVEDDALGEEKSGRRPELRAHVVNMLGPRPVATDEEGRGWFDTDVSVG